MNDFLFGDGVFQTEISAASYYSVVIDNVAQLRWYDSTCYRKHNLAGDLISFTPPEYNNHLQTLYHTLQNTSSQVKLRVWESVRVKKGRSSF